jgi:hypothetical protein
MKAEHRRELQTNALADHMGRLLEGVRHKPTSSSTILWIIGGLAMLIAGVWYFTSNGNNWSSAWVKLDGQSSLKALEDVAKENPGTMPGRTARFQRARLELEQGFRSLYGSDRGQAIKSVESARQLYRELAPECRATPILAQEALMGEAKAEEALIGVPQEIGTGTRGDFDRAVQLYRQVAKDFPDTYLGKAAAERASELESNRAAVVKFYDELNKQAQGKETENKKKS